MIHLFLKHNTLVKFAFELLRRLVSKESFVCKLDKLCRSHSMFWLTKNIKLKRVNCLWIGLYWSHCRSQSTENTEDLNCRGPKFWFKLLLVLVNNTHVIKSKILSKSKFSKILNLPCTEQYNLLNQLSYPLQPYLCMEGWCVKPPRVILCKRVFGFNKWENCTITAEACWQQLSSNTSLDRNWPSFSLQATPIHQAPHTALCSMAYEIVHLKMNPLKTCYGWRKRWGQLTLRLSISLQ